MKDYLLKLWYRFLLWLEMTFLDKVTKKPKLRRIKSQTDFMRYDPKLLNQIRKTRQRAAMLKALRDNPNQKPQNLVNELTKAYVKNG